MGRRSRCLPHCHRALAVAACRFCSICGTATFSIHLSARMRKRFGCGAIVRSAGCGQHPAGRRVGMGTHDGAAQLARGIDAASHRKMARQRTVPPPSSIILSKGPRIRNTVLPWTSGSPPTRRSISRSLFFHHLLTAVAFFSVLWTVGGSIDIVIFGRTVTIPGYLVIGVIIYSGAMSGLMVFFGHHLTSVIERMNQTEAEFRAAVDAFQRRGRTHRNQNKRSRQT